MHILNFPKSYNYKENKFLHLAFKFLWVEIVETLINQMVILQEIVNYWSLKLQ